MGETGEIQVGSATTGADAGVWTPMLGYWDDPAAALRADLARPLHTGDTGRLDADGHLFERGRGDKMTRRGGAVSPPPKSSESSWPPPPLASTSSQCRRRTPRPADRRRRRPATGPTSTSTPLRTHLPANLARTKIPPTSTPSVAYPLTRWTKVIEVDANERTDRCSRPRLTAQLLDIIPGKIAAGAAGWITVCYGVLNRPGPYRNTFEGRLEHATLLADPFQACDGNCPVGLRDPRRRRRGPLRCTLGLDLQDRSCPRDPTPSADRCCVGTMRSPTATTSVTNGRNAIK